MQIVFWVSVSVFLYVLIGYPVLLACLARWRAKPIHKAPFFPTVTVIVPTYNGQDYIAAKLHSIKALDYPSKLLNIIVVSDGSIDKTEEIVRTFSNVELIVLPRGGKCAALNIGIERAKGELLLLTDVRQLLDKNCLKELTANFIDETVGVCSGEIIVTNGYNNETNDISIYWKFESRMRDWLGKLDSIFGASGQLYIIRKCLTVPIPSDILNDDMYLPLNAFFKGFRLIYEKQAIAYDVPISRKVELRRKTRTLAGNIQVLFYIPQLLTFENRMLWHYLSYKIGRLMLPWLMILIAISSFWLPASWKMLLIILQVVFYGLALLDPLIASSKLKRFSSASKTFCAMMIAVMASLQILWLKNPQKLWIVTSTTKQL